MKIKRLIACLIVVISVLQLHAQGISFRKLTLDSALIVAKAEHKPVLMYGYANWCSHCKKMKDTVLNQKIVGDIANQNYICIGIELEQAENRELQKKLNIFSFPTFVFFNPDGEEIYRLNGEYKTKDLLTELNNSLQTSQQLPYLKAKYEEDVANSVNCFLYLRTLKKGGLDYKEVVERHFATQRDAQLIDAVNWKIFTYGVSDIDSRVFQYVVNHQKDFAKLTSPDRVRAKLVYEATATLKKLVYSQDSVEYEKKRNTILQFKQYSTDSLVYQYDLIHSSTRKNWEDYEDICKQSVKKYSWNNKTVLTEIVTNYVQHITDKKALLRASEWAERALTLEETYDRLIVCAQLSLKIKNFEKGQSYVEKALNIARKNGFDDAEAKRLKKEME